MLNIERTGDECFQFAFLLALAEKVATVLPACLRASGATLLLAMRRFANENFATVYDDVQFLEHYFSLIERLVGEHPRKMI